MAFIPDPTPARAALEATYSDLADILRLSAPAQSGIARPEYTPAARQIPCGLSFSGDGSAVQVSQQSVRADGVLFCAPDTDALPGDRVQVWRPGQQTPLAFEAVGLPRRYDTQLELPMRFASLA